jgi:phenylacetate-CoA ligase
VLAPGQLGRVVVTDFHNYTSPLIRYEIGDVARWAPPTECGITWPAISSQIERDDGWSQTENGEASGFSLFNVDFHNFRNLSDYQIIKFSDLLLFYYSAWPELSSTQKNVIRESLKGLVSNVDEISFQPFSVAKPAPTGARLQVYQSPLPYREDWSQQELF